MATERLLVPVEQYQTARGSGYGGPYYSTSCRFCDAREYHKAWCPFYEKAKERANADKEKHEAG